MATAAPVLEAIASATKRKQRESRAQFFEQVQKLIADAAHGVQICEQRAEEAAQLIELSGMSDADFAAAVETYKQREADAALHQKLPELTAECNRIEAELQARGEKFNAYVKAEKAALAAIVEGRNAAGADRDRAQFASARLYNSYRNPLVQEQEREIGVQLAAKHQQIAEQAERLKQQCTIPLANVKSELAAELRHTEECRKVSRDPGNVTRIAQLQTGKANLEARLLTEEKILNGLAAEEAYLQNELQALAQRHYEV